ncbi:basic proline-rich protein-like [Moschus berezovskii]|uniref:basic proline-rich protein-like n=1 Tax=Moschus berezovskii TaxID=68408 RepID=UPI00244441DF|nr:basic proline-rich protein-like [Moschus berezovskii]
MSSAAAPAWGPWGPAGLRPCPPAEPAAGRAASPHGLGPGPRSSSRHLASPISLKKAAVPASAQASSTGFFSGPRLPSALSSPRASPFRAGGSPLQGPSLTPQRRRVCPAPRAPLPAAAGLARPAGWFSLGHQPSSVPFTGLSPSPAPQGWCPRGSGLAAASCRSSLPDGAPTPHPLPPSAKDPRSVPQTSSRNLKCSTPCVRLLFDGTKTPQFLQVSDTLLFFIQ